MERSSPPRSLSSSDSLNEFTRVSKQRKNIVLEEGNDPRVRRVVHQVAVPCAKIFFIDRNFSYTDRILL